MKIQEFDYFNRIKGVDSQNLPSAMSQDFDFDIQTIDPSPANPPDQIGPTGDTCITGGTCQLTRSSVCCTFICG